MPLFDELKTQVAPVVKHYRSDLEHDRQWIEDNPGMGFVHVARESGTHIFGLPCVDALVEDKEEPYLFGTARPSYIYHNILKALKSGLMNSGVVWHVFDGRNLRKRPADACIAFYEQQLRSATKQAERRRRRAVAA